ncbi:4'-phosphopantetheinyl transferase superfamily protein [Clostridium sp. YIM B02569]|uniref:4'-phosphopantetheinyl transferase family protein n=1 Tax=Clostridium sp. YIM B02569 TaxID=2911967 RepID=UPI001EEC82CF|nr:4'-phosphopantetheinyl transferase superfamily protein [Clostridium sp. YIM B02569]
MVQVYAVSIDSNNLELLLNSYIYLLNEEKRNKIYRFMYIEDKQRTIVGDLLIKAILMEKLNINYNKVEFYCNKFGKLYLKGFNNIYFNISHSGKWIVCAIDDEEIGIDIEEVKPIDINIGAVAFSDNELDLLSRQEEYNKLNFFYRLWTLKESYVKSVGMGLNMQLKSFSIDVDKVYSHSKILDRYFRQYVIEKNYIVSICGLKNKFTEEIKFKNIEELYNKVISQSDYSVQASI